MSVGNPGWMALDDFGSLVWEAFGHPPYLVGSALTEKAGWRDVDVRLMLPDDEWTLWELGEPGHESMNGRWRAMCRAFTVLGQQMTGLPIDFQIQQQMWANKMFPGVKARSGLGIVPLRFVGQPASKGGTDGTE